MLRRWRFLGSIVAIVLGTLTALPPAAAVSAPDLTLPHGQLVEPSQRIDGLIGVQVPIEAWHRINTLPQDQNPWLGNGEPCVPLGERGKVLLVYGTSDAQCTVKRGTAVYIIGITGWCSNLDEPPFFAETYAEQRRCVIASFRGQVESIEVVVNGHRFGDIHKPRFEMLAPRQSRDQLRPDNVWGFPPELITYVVYGWGAWLVDLPIGTHEIHSTTVWTDGSAPHRFDPIITVER